MSSQIANSLVFEADGAPLLVLTSGAHRVDTAKVAALVGAARVRRASPELVQSVTGQTIGGVAPVGHPAPLRTFVDRTLGSYAEVWAAGGIAHAVFPRRSPSSSPSRAGSLPTSPEPTHAPSTAKRGARRPLADTRRGRRVGIALERVERAAAHCGG